jgi:hypothetical protein
MAASRLEAPPPPAVQPCNAIRQDMLKRSDIQASLALDGQRSSGISAWIIASASVELIM